MHDNEHGVPSTSISTESWTFSSLLSSDTAHQLVSGDGKGGVVEAYPSTPPAD